MDSDCSFDSSFESALWVEHPDLPSSPDSTLSTPVSKTRSPTFRPNRLRLGLSSNFMGPKKTTPPQSAPGPSSKSRVPAHLDHGKHDDSFDAPPKKFKHCASLSTPGSGPALPKSYKDGMKLMYYFDELRVRTIEDDSFIDIIQNPARQLFTKDEDNEKPYIMMVPSMLRDLRKAMKEAAAAFFEKQRNEIDAANDAELAILRAGFSPSEKDILSATVSSLIDTTQAEAEKRVAAITLARPESAGNRRYETRTPAENNRRFSHGNGRRGGRGRKA